MIGEEGGYWTNWSLELEKLVHYRGIAVVFRLVVGTVYDDQGEIGR